MRIFIYGSCVSNDAFSLVEHDLTIAAYVPRTSVASAFSTIKAPAYIVQAAKANIENLSHKYWVLNDLEKRVANALENSSYDIVLVDFFEERYDLALVDGALLTLTEEFKRSKVDFSEFEIIRFASDRHFELWKDGFERFANTVQADKVYINRVYWADKSDSGSKFTAYDINGCNKYFDKLYKHISDNYNFKFIDYAPEMFIASSSHQWGMSPFHYIHDFYANTIRALKYVEGKIENTQK